MRFSRSFPDEVFMRKRRVAALLVTLLAPGRRSGRAPPTRPLDGHAAAVARLDAAQRTVAVTLADGSREPVRLDRRNQDQRHPGARREGHGPLFAAARTARTWRTRSRVART